MLVPPVAIAPAHPVYSSRKALALAEAAREARARRSGLPMADAQVASAAKVSLPLGRPTLSLQR